jgi:gamma-hexachlorocyclohexane dehydrochlorinase
MTRPTGRVAPTSTEARLDELESRAAIAKLLADYCHGVDKHDLERFRTIWHPDATLAIGDPFGDIAGVDAILNFMRNIVWIEVMPESHHWTTNTSLQFPDPEHGIAFSDVLAATTDPAGVRHTISATYQDRFERRHGEWRFQRRDATIHYQLPIAVSDAPASSR